MARLFTTVRVDACAAASRPPHPCRPPVCRSRHDPPPLVHAAAGAHRGFPIRPPRLNGRAGAHSPSAHRTAAAHVHVAFAPDAAAAHTPRGSKAPMQPTRRENPCAAPVVSALMSPLRRIDRSLKIPSTVCGLLAAIVWTPVGPALFVVADWLSRGARHVCTQRGGS